MGQNEKLRGELGFSCIAFRGSSVITMY